MEYKPLTFPLPPEVAADLCDPGSPPEGHVRIVLIKFDGDDLPIVAEIYKGFLDDLPVLVGSKDGLQYRTGVCPPDLLYMVSEYSG